MLGYLLVITVTLTAGLFGFAHSQNTEISPKTCTYSFVVPQTDIISTCKAYSSSLVASLNQKITDLQNKVTQLQFSTSKGSGGSHVNSFLNSHFSCSCDNQTTFTFAYRDCQDVKVLTGGMTGIYQIEPVKSTGQILAVTNSSSPTAKTYKYWVTETWGAFNVYCDLNAETVGWTLLMRRSKMDVSFDRPWNDYKNGFGNVKKGDFWLGLDKMYKITNQKFGAYKLWIIITLKNGVPHVFPYGTFVIGDESSGYRLTVKNYEGKLSSQMYDGASFITKDKRAYSGTPSTTPATNWNTKYCVKDSTSHAGGGWWFSKAMFIYNNYQYCGNSNLNAKKPYWSQMDNIASVEMKILPSDLS